MGKSPGGPVPVIVMGLGFIGQEIVKAAASSSELKLVGAVDSGSNLVGKKLGDLVGNPALAMKVVPTLEQALARTKGAVLLHATGSRLPQVMEQLLEAARLGAHVVSTCEELAFPWFKHPALAEKLERAASRSGVSIVGTGVNPGFVLDRLVACLGQVCGEIRHVKATRTVDARTRREALQRKIGAGLGEDEFLSLVDKEQLGHVGLVESAALAALGLGIDCDDFEEEVAPVIAQEDITGGAFLVRAGRVAGIGQTAVGLCDGQEKVRLELTIALGAERPGDHIELDAEPRVVLDIPGGLAGDRATANLVVNAAARVAAAEAGLLTVLELPSGR